MKKAMTAAEKRYVALAAEDGCIVEGCGAPAEWHHARAFGSMGKRAPHCIGFPLCPVHHRLGNEFSSIHAGQFAWERIYGTEAELINKTILRVMR